MSSKWSTSIVDTTQPTITSNHVGDTVTRKVGNKIDDDVELTIGDVCIFSGDVDLIVGDDICIVD